MGFRVYGLGIHRESGGAFLVLEDFKTVQGLGFRV